MDLRRVKTYVISPGTGAYEPKLRNALAVLAAAGFEDVEHVPSAVGDKPDCLTQANISILEKAEPPFIIVEDDIALFDEHGGFGLMVPHGAAAVCLGVSVWTYPYNTIRADQHIRANVPSDFEAAENGLVRVRGMTGGHAILFLGKAHTRQLASCALHHMTTRHTPHDIVAAALQHQHKVYAMKRPIFYQDGRLGGQEPETRLRWQDGHFRQSHPRGQHQDT